MILIILLTAAAAFLLARGAYLLGYRNGYCDGAIAEAEEQIRHPDEARRRRREWDAFHYPDETKHP